MTPVVERPVGVVAETSNRVELSVARGHRPAWLVFGKRTKAGADFTAVHGSTMVDSGVPGANLKADFDGDNYGSATN